MPRVDPAVTVVVAALALFYLAVDMARVSMGLDGTVYAAIANALAAGQGGFWSLPHFEAHAGAFRDHPPLGIWLQSLLFSLFGDHFWVEKLYSLLLGLGICGLLMWLWRALTEDAAAWWPLFIFLLMPVTTFAIKNNTLETLLTVVTLSAVLAAWYGQHRAALNVLVGVLCFAGLLIKGPVALFVLGVPGCFAVICRDDWRRGIVASSIATVTVCVLVAVLMFDAAARNNLLDYLHLQLLPSLDGRRPAEHGRGYLLLQLAYQWLVACAAIGLVWLVSRRRNPTRNFRALLIIGLSAALPLLISPRQYRHYLLPSLPYFALAAAILVPAPRLPGRAVHWWLASLVVISLAAWRVAGHFGAPGEHDDELADAALVARMLALTGGSRGTVVFCDDLLRRRLYLSRHHSIRTLLAGGADRVPDTAWAVCPADLSPRGFTAAASLSEGQRLWAPPQSHPGARP